jgi:hypothetical protein
MLESDLKAGARFFVLKLLELSLLQTLLKMGNFCKSLLVKGDF